MDLGFILENCRWYKGISTVSYITQPLQQAQATVNLKILMLLLSPRQRPRVRLRLNPKLRVAAPVTPVGDLLPVLTVLLPQQGPVPGTSTPQPKIIGGRRAMDADGIRRTQITHIIAVRLITFVNIKMSQRLNGPARDVNRKMQLAQAHTPIKMVNASGK